MFIKSKLFINLFIYLGFYVAFNTVQVISRRVVGRAEETSTYSSLGFCTVSCRPTASNCQLSHLRPCRGLNPGLRGGRRECYHSATVAPVYKVNSQGHICHFLGSQIICYALYVMQITQGPNQALCVNLDRLSPLKSHVKAVCALTLTSHCFSCTVLQSPGPQVVDGNLVLINSDVGHL